MAGDDATVYEASPPAQEASAATPDASSPGEAGSSPLNPVVGGVGTAPTTFSHAFTEMVAGGDPGAGIAFWLNTSTGITVCFSDVSIVGS
jgi:hypothetical protein